MAIGAIGKKLGVTRVFEENGNSHVVTVVEVSPMHVVQVKSKDNDGYSAIQVTTGEKAAHRVNKPAKGHFAKSNVIPGLGLWEFRLEEQQLSQFDLGTKIECDILEAGQKVSVTGVSKGKGFAGNVKRNNFSTQRNSHGNSLSHRAPGSIGQCQTPGRVFKGKKMAGRMGGVKTTVKNLEIFNVDKDKNIVLVKGLIPGAPGGFVIINPNFKASVVA